MTDDIEVRIARALTGQGSAEFTTPSGPTQTLMGELLEEHNLQGYAQLCNVLAQAYPGNRPYVRGCIPAQIRNFLIKHRGVDVSSLEAWGTDNLGWEEELRETLRNPLMFEAKIEEIAGEIKDREHEAPERKRYG